MLKVKRTGPDQRRAEAGMTCGDGSGGSRPSSQVPFWVIELSVGMVGVS